LLYLDESGVPNGWQAQRNFVLGAVAIHEGQVYRLSKQLDEIQTRFFPDRDFSIEFHAERIKKGKEIFRELLPDRREELMDELYNFIADVPFPNLIAFATCLHYSMVQDAEQVLRDTLQDVCSRFNKLLTRRFAFHPNKGLLIIDDAHQSEYRRLLADFKRIGTDYEGYLRNMIDIPYFARSPDSRMIQIADLVSYAVFQYYEHNEAAYIERIYPKFDRREAQHPADGLKHITRNHQTCTCMACSWRRDRGEQE
jgi:hypothetical protein